MGNSVAGCSSQTSPSIRTVKVSGSTSMRGNASLSGMSALPTLRTSPTATNRRFTASRSASPESIACCDTKCSDVAAAADAAAPNIGRGNTGCGVGIDALASPIAAQAIMPPLITACGRTPKKAGSHSTKSASLPTSTEPISPSSPWAMAGQIVYLAT